MTTYVLFMQQHEVNSNMALALGNLLGAVANATTAVAHEKTLKSFLTNINDFGVQVKNNFEVNFSGLQDITFRVTDMTLPTVKANTTEIFYDGRSIPVTINYDYEHDFSMTILNDAHHYCSSPFIRIFTYHSSSAAMIAPMIQTKIFMIFLLQPLNIFICV